MNITIHNLWVAKSHLFTPMFLSAKITAVFYLHGFDNFIHVSPSKRLFLASSCSNIILLSFDFRDCIPPFYYHDDGNGKLLRELRDYYQSTRRHIPKTSTFISYAVETSNRVFLVLLFRAHPRVL